MQQLSNQEKWKPWQGGVLEIVYLILLLTICSYVQSNWGMFGLLASELIFLATAIIVTKIHKTPLKEVFPIKKISFVDIIGICFFAAGSVMINLVCVGISSVLFPSQLGEAAELTGFFSGMGFIPTVLILAVSPAVCEEAIMRGALLSHFRGLKKEWLIVVIVGVCFGILHVSLLRFLSTAVLGMLLAYLMVKRNNILLPMILHFLNNFVSSLATLATKNVDVEANAAALESINPWQLLGTYTFIGFLAPILILIGVQLMKLTKLNWKVWVAGAVLSSVMLGVGVIALLNTTLNRETVCQFTADTVLDSEQANTYEIEIDEEGSYQIALICTPEDGTVTYRLATVDGNTVIFEDSGSGVIIENQMVQLEPGSYLLTFEGDSEANGHSLVINFQVIKN